MLWKDYIKSLEAEFIGQKVIFEGREYTITKVDYNGIIHINKPARFTETTAVYGPAEARKNII